MDFPLDFCCKDSNLISIIPSWIFFFTYCLFFGDQFSVNTLEGDPKHDGNRSHRDPINYKKDKAEDTLAHCIVKTTVGQAIILNVGLIDHLTLTFPSP